MEDIAEIFSAFTGFHLNVSADKMLLIEVGVHIESQIPPRELIF